MKRKNLLNTILEIANGCVRTFIFLGICILAIALVESITIGPKGGFAFTQIFGICMFGITLITLIMGSIRVLMTAYYRKQVKEKYHIDI